MVDETGIRDTNYVFPPDNKINTGIVEERYGKDAEKSEMGG